KTSWGFDRNNAERFKNLDQYQEASARMMARFGPGRPSIVWSGLSGFRPSTRDWNGIHSVARCSSTVVGVTSTVRTFCSPQRRSQDSAVATEGRNHTLPIRQ